MLRCIPQGWCVSPRCVRNTIYPSRISKINIYHSSLRTIIMDAPQSSSAIRPLDVQRLLNEIDDNGKALFRGQGAARTTLIAKARSLIAALETPAETMTWIAWAEVCKIPVVHYQFWSKYSTLLPSPQGKLQYALPSISAFSSISSKMMRVSRRKTALHPRLVETQN